MEVLRLHAGRDHGRGEIVRLLRAVADSLSRILGGCFDHPEEGTIKDLR